MWLIGTEISGQGYSERAFSKTAGKKLQWWFCKCGGGRKKSCGNGDERSCGDDGNRAKN
ncbi:hypothetical protein HID58_086389 [Brassica napus]|uniref:Uncharacterized protein n=1 Tax=Brassica napus TaxID=3708 RepID=A0ABQ7XQC2_BRANA|nr:hypothetical protein HID58_086389 [Brassica napus]